ncbi:hypothetical protein CQW23_33513 [Capsicum baccatum]|uniref:Uncharacterized protein n=1 Tax=Capsicum baccatum TaxID=33114 RepID=A0A2G2V1M4_CAPBA|nr:hypothetical protein CQW23_33513 [Capsicum baccatum]
MKAPYPLRLPHPRIRTAAGGPRHRTMKRGSRGTRGRPFDSPCARNARGGGRSIELDTAWALGCLGALLPWCHGVTVPWCLGALVPWRHGAMVPWRLGAMAPRCLWDGPAGPPMVCTDHLVPYYVWTW